jgi:hypothetical protein
MRGMKLSGSFIVAVGCAVSASPAAADVALLPISQSRSIDVIGRWGPPQSSPTLIETDSRSAPGFALFQETVLVQHNDVFERYHNRATQDSEMTSLMVRASGSGETLATGGNSGFASGSANSRFSFTFDLLEPTTFTLQGTLTYSAMISGNVQNGVGLSLETPPTPIFSVSQNSSMGSPTNIPYSTGGTLSPGRYTLSLGMLSDSMDNSFAPSSTTTSTYSMLFNVPEPSVGLMLGALAMLGRRRMRRRMISAQKAPLAGEV